MPLHVNLYHEVQEQERARQRDPFRLAMLAALLVAIGFVANYFVVLERSHNISLKYGELQGQWATISPKAKTAKARQDEIDAEVAASNAMMKNVNGRFYWAPVLGEMLKTVPRTVQLTHMEAEVSGGANPGSFTLSITGVSSAIEPRKEAEALRVALVSRLGAAFGPVSSVFKNLDDSDDIVILDGRRLATASFGLDFQVQVNDAAATTPGTAAGRKTKLASAQ